MSLNMYAFQFTYSKLLFTLNKNKIISPTKSVYQAVLPTSCLNFR